MQLHSLDFFIWRAISPPSAPHPIALKAAAPQWCSDKSPLPQLGSVLLPFAPVWCRHTNASFLTISYFRFQTWKAKCIFLFLFFFPRTSITLWPFTRQTVHCIHAFQHCCPPRITTVYCISYNIYHLVSQSVTTGLMKWVICYSAQITVIEESSWEMFIYWTFIVQCAQTGSQINLWVWIVTLRWAGRKELVKLVPLKENF